MTSALARTTLQFSAAIAFAFYQLLYAAIGRGYLALTHFGAGGGAHTAFFNLADPDALQRAANRSVALAPAADVYFGVGLLRERPESGRGKAEHVFAVPGLWMDFDIADATAHSSKKLPPDLAAVQTIIDEFGLRPTITVRSGHGLHCYWLYPTPWTRTDQWAAQEHLAGFQRVIRSIAAKHGYELDNTSDLPRLLRVPGTGNHKNPEDVKVVTFEETGPRYEVEVLWEHIEKATAALSTASPGCARFAGFFPGHTPADDGAAEPGNSEATHAANYPLADLDRILDGCAVIRRWRDDAATLTEPEWYAGLSIVARCEDGIRLAHEWSRQYPTYTETEAEKKIAHALESSGPRTCEWFAGEHPDLCGTCPKRGKVKSPIVLGTKVMLDVSQAAWPKPQRLRAALPPVAEFDVELLPDTLRPWVIDLSRQLQIAIDFPAATAMVMLSAATGRRAYIMPKRLDKKWRVIPNVWGALVARPGLLKTPTINAVLAPLRAIAAVALEEHRAAMEQYEKDLEQWQMRKDAWKKKASRAVSAGNDPDDFEEPKPEKPKCVRYIANDATIEKLHSILEDNPQGILLLRDELTGWWVALDTRGRERDRPFFLESWDGDSSYVIDRIGRGTLRVPHLCLCIFGGIQPEKLKAYLGGAVRGGINDDGLVQRFQFLVWPDQPQTFENIDEQHNVAAEQAVEGLLRRIIAIPALEPRAFSFLPDAQELFDEWRTELELRLRRDRMPPVLESHLAKYRKLMPAIALLLHLAEGGDGDVPLIHAQRAAAWCEYLESHARRAYASVASEAHRLAASLGEKIQAGKLGTSFTVREVYTREWADLDRKEGALKALEVLEDAGWVRSHELQPGPQGGRPTVLYAVNPEVFHE